MSRSQPRLVRDHVEPLEGRTFLSGTSLESSDISALAAIASPHTMQYDGWRDLLYVTALDGLVHRYDARTDTSLEPLHAGLAPRGMDFSPDGGTLYVADAARTANGDGAVHVIDLDDGSASVLTYETDADENLGDVDVVVLPDGTAFVGSDNAAGPIRRIDLSSGNELALPVELQGDDFSVRGSDDHGTTFFLGLSRSYVFDAASDRVIKTVGERRDTGAIAPDGSFLTSGLLRPYSSYANVLDRLWEPVTSLPVGEVPVAVDPTGSLLYTLAYDADRLSAINTGTWTKRYEMVADVGPQVVRSTAVVADDGSRLFVLSGEGVQSIPIGARPRVLLAPSVVRPGEATPATVTFSKPGGMPEGWSGTLHFTSDDPAAVLPADTAVTLAEGEPFAFDFTFNTPGSRTLTVTDVATGLSAAAPPLTVDATPPTVTGFIISPFEPRDMLRVEGRFQDDVALDPAAVPGAGDFEVVGPDGTVYPLFWGVGERPTPPSDAICFCTPHVPQTFYGMSTPGGSWDPSDEGTYTLRALAGAVRDTAGNESVAADVDTFTFDYEQMLSYTPASGHDLAVSLDASPPVQSRRGTSIRGSVSLLNVGQEVADGEASISISVVPDGGALNEPGARTVFFIDRPIALAPDAARRFPFRLTRLGDLPEGTYRLAASVQRLDPAGLVREPDELNNLAFGAPFDVRVPRVVALGPPEALVLTPGRPARAVLELRNDGTAAANGRYLITLLASPDGAPDDDATGSIELGSVTRSVRLPAGTQRALALNLKVPATIATGGYRISAVIEPA